MATRDDDGLVAAPCPWETLPVEMRRKVVFDWVSDRDLGSCLLAGDSFHVLTARDLEARRYVYATVEGMCFAGDVRGLEYALRQRPATEPVDWAMCFLEASVMGRRSIVEWIVARVPPPFGLDDMWTVTPMPRRHVITKMAAHAVFGPHPSGGCLALDRLYSWTCNGNRLLNALVSHMSNDKDHTTAISLRGIGIARSLQGPFDPHVIDDLIERGRLADAVSLVTNPAAVCGMPHWLASKLASHVGQACAYAGQAGLIGKLADLIDRPTCALEYREAQRTAITCGAARGGHMDLLEFAVSRWPSAASVATDAVAHAVVGGHVECVRWLCAHGFTCKDAAIWYGRRAAYVSALALALASGRRDMVDAMRRAVDIRQAACDAFHDAVSSGDLRVARSAFSLWMSAPSPPAPEPREHAG